MRRLMGDTMREFESRMLQQYLEPPKPVALGHGVFCGCGCNSMPPEYKQTATEAGSIDRRAMKQAERHRIETETRRRQHREIVDGGTGTCMYTTPREGKRERCPYGCDK